MKPAAFVLLSLLPIAAAAQFCVDAAGRVSFQQAACATQEKQQPLKLRADSPAAPASTPAAEPMAAVVDQGASADQRMLRKMEGERRVLELERSVQAIEFSIANRNVQMQNEFAALRDLKASARNNLAGATYGQSLSTEMQAVASKYKALNDTDQERLKVLRTDLAGARQAIAR